MFWTRGRQTQSRGQEGRHLDDSITQTCDQTDRTAVKALWVRFQRDGIFVDTLVLNAATFSEEKPLLELGAEQVWAAYETNVRGPLDMVEGFNKQPGDKPKVRATPSFVCGVLKDMVNG
jgi:NADP-dependent 3-hydroxy acid dehydrogenase YdfG